MLTREDMLDSPRGSVTKREYKYDALRLFAMALVIGYHYTERFAELYSDAAPPVIVSARLATLAVSLFLYLVGYFTYPSARRRVSASVYLRRRATRLLPTYWLALSVTSIALVVSGFSDVSLLTVVANAALVNRLFGVPSIDGAYWYLTIVVVFTLLVAIYLHLDVAVMQRHLPTLYIASFFMLGLADARWACVNHYIAYLLFHYVNKCLAGVYVARMWASADPMTRRRCAAAVVMLLLGEPLWVGTGRFVCDVAALLIFLAVSNPLFCSVTPEGRVRNLLVFMSDESYFIYLVHQMIGYVCISTVMSLGFAYSLGLLLALMVVGALAFLHRSIRKQLRKHVT